MWWGVCDGVWWCMWWDVCCVCVCVGGGGVCGGAEILIIIFRGR